MCLVRQRNGLHRYSHKTRPCHRHVFITNNRLTNNNKENFFRFLNWKVYQDAKQFAYLSFKIVKKLPKEYRFEIGSQKVTSSEDSKRN